MKTEIYEVVDSTDDEMYFPLGLFLLEGEALKAVREADRSHPVSEMDVDGREVISIFSRPEGYISGFGKKVWEFVREEYYDEGDDEYYWKVVRESKF